MDARVEIHRSKQNMSSQVVQANCHPPSSYVITYVDTESDWKKDGRMTGDQDSKSKVTPYLRGLQGANRGSDQQKKVEKNKTRGGGNLRKFHKIQ